jgi:DNA invertase Pin-like site-specific DNA recombinase
MPQIQLPVFPEGVTHITPELAFSNVNGQITYFNGSMPIFIHDVKDTRTFRMITSQFCVGGATRLVEISKAFGVPAISVKRAVKLYRKEGPSGFFKARKSRGKSVLTEKVVKQAQELLNQFIEPKEIAVRLKIKTDTLRKAIQSGRLQKPEKKVQPEI